MPQRPSEQLSQDAVFDILSNARRRFVLHYLREAGEPVELGELALELAAWENDVPAEDLTKQQRKRVYVSLYQTHIQKLAEANVVEYDDQSRMVSLASGASHIGTYLSGEEADAASGRWQDRYLALAIASGIVYALVALDVSVFAALPDLWVGLGIVLSFTILASGHVVSTYRQTADISTDSLIQDDA